jgi:hypothetical protein
MLRELPSPLAVVCHDAGAANHVLAWLEAEPVDGRSFVEGPAEQLWRQHRPPGRVAASLDDAMDGAGALLSGTGWASPLEHEARRAARARGIPSVAVLDHWVNYPMRFERDGVTVLPDEIWVCDVHAAAEARRCFPGLRVREQPNRYLEAQLRAIAPVCRAGPDLLVVLEPARSDWGRPGHGAGEFQALDHLAARLGTLGLPAGAALRLRPHPSDAAGKYDAWIARHAPQGARLDDAPTLAEAISRCASVAGCESYALVVALAAGRRVICTLPPWAPPCRLPHPDIVHLKQLAPPR